MPPSSSADRVSARRSPGRLARWPAFPYDVTVRISLWVERAGGRRAVRLGRLAAALDRRRRADRAAHGAKPVGRQRPGLQRGRAGRGQHVDDLDLSDLSRRLDRRPGAAGVRGAGVGAGAQRGRGGTGDAGRRPAVRAEPARPAGAAAARRRAGLHRGAARTRLRHLGPRKRFGVGLSGPAVVDDGLLVAGLARLPRPAAAAAAAQGRAAGPPQSTLRRCTVTAAHHQRRQPILRRGTGFRRRAERAGASRAGAHRRARADHDAGRGPRLAAPRADRRRGRPGAGRLRDLPDGLLRPAVPRHRAGQGCVGIQMGRRASSIWPTSTSPTCCGRPRSCLSGLALVVLVTRGRPWWIRRAARPATAGWRAGCKARPP